jgi:hypothetical protein
MLTDQSVKWEPVSGIDAPCADFSFNYRTPDTVSVTLYFKGLLPKNLLLIFRDVIALQLCQDWVWPIPHPKPFTSLPRCGGRYPLSVCALVRINPSSWLKINAPDWSIRNRDIAYSHSVIITEEKSLHIIALEQVEVERISEVQAG